MAYILGSLHLSWSLLSELQDSSSSMWLPPPHAFKTGRDCGTLYFEDFLKGFQREMISVYNDNLCMCVWKTMEGDESTL